MAAVLMGEGPAVLAEAEVRWLLEGLGGTSMDVADSLRGLGVTGERNCTSACPLAEYLRARGVPAPAVETADAFFDDWARRVDLPEPCRVFVEDFDAGHYPELIKGPAPCG
jgi:hypothetical protein